MRSIRSAILIIVLGLLFSDGLLAVEYKVAVRATRGIEHAVKQWQPTMDALSKQIPEHTFTLLPIISLDEITQRVGRKAFDFVLTNPSSFVEIEHLYGAVALATLNNKRADTAQSRFGSVIFTHVKNTDILTLKDLKDKTLMAVSEPAFGGWRVSWLEMLEQGFNPHRELKALLFTESRTQPEVAQAVLSGKVDAGVVRTDLLERMEAAGKIDMRFLRILNNKDVRDFPFFLSTKLYSEWAFSALNQVPDEQMQQVASVLLAIDKDSQAAQAGKYVGWVPPQDYRPVQELMKRLEVGPYARQ